jgi:hypothetical protein
MLTSASMPAVARSSFSLIEIVIQSQALRQQQDSSHQTKAPHFSHGTPSQEPLSCDQVTGRSYWVAGDVMRRALLCCVALLPRM